MTGRHVVFGSGPLGTAVAKELLHRGESVALVNRSGKATVSGVEVIVGDAYDPAFAANAVRGAAVVYQCAQPAYHRWTEDFPRLQQAILDAAAAEGARLVIADNLYSYGDPAGSVITETSPEKPTAKKGLLRKMMADAALQAHRDGTVEVALSRPSDYFGPGYDIMGDNVFRRAVAGRRMHLVGSATAPHSFSFVPDAGKAMAILGTSELSWGQVWIPPVQPAMTQQAFADQVWSLAGQPGRGRTGVLGRSGVALLGMVSKPIRELREMLYGFERPFIVDSSKFESTFGVAPTPLDQALGETLAWYRNANAGEGAGAGRAVPL